MGNGASSATILPLQNKITGGNLSYEKGVIVILIVSYEEIACL